MLMKTPENKEKQLEAMFDPAHIAAQQEYERVLFSIAAGWLKTPWLELEMGQAELARHPYRQKVSAVAAQKSAFARARHLLNASSSFASWKTLWENDAAGYTPDNIAKLNKAFQSMMDSKRDLGLKVNPHDPVEPWIQNQSPGLTREFVEGVKAELIELCGMLMPKRPVLAERLGIDLSVEQKQKLAKRILLDMGVDFKRLELSFDVEHPLCLGTGDKVYLGLTPDKNDSLTYYVLEVVHEGFHALLRQNSEIMTHAAIDETFAIMGDHCVGRSKGFANYLALVLREEFGIVKPSLDIHHRLNECKEDKARIALDPLQYPRGISLMYDMEVAVLTGEIESTQLEVWFDRHHEMYHGRLPKTNLERAYQDMQPFTGESAFRSASYLVAQPAAFQLYEALYEPGPEWERRLEVGDWKPIQSFVRRAAQIAADSYDLQEFVLKATGRSYTTSVYKRHMIETYGVSLLSPPPRPKLS